MDTESNAQQSDPWWHIVALTVLPIGSALFATGSWLAAAVAFALWVVAMRPALLVIFACLVIGARADAAISALTPVATRPVDNVEVTLVDDPRPTDFGLRMVAEFEGERVVATVPFALISRVGQLGAGDAMVVAGTVRGQRPSGSWAVSRRITGNLAISEVHHTRPAGGARGAATTARNLIKDGAASLKPKHQVLFTGLVFGDDRGQDVIVADNFRAAGLGHLLAVSGQNVVFVLLLASPLLMGIRTLSVRTVVALAILVGFGFLTRFEPSVVRAIVMAGLVVIAANAGRPATARRVLPVAVTGLVLFDPLLGWSLAFQLSVLATLGLVVLTPWLLERVTAPRALHAAAAATVAAQLFVSPLLFASFGTVSAMAVPANLLAAPAAAGVMMWGLVVGPVAGLSPPAVASLLHQPTSAMLWWIDGVAAYAARGSVSELTPWHLVALVLALGAISRWPLLGSSLLTAVALVVFVAPPSLPVGQHQLVTGLEVTHSPAGYNVVVLDASVRADDAVQAVRQSRLERIDLLIVTSAARSVGGVVAVLTERFEIVEVWAPPNHQTPGGRTVDPLAGRIGDLSIAATSDGTVLVVVS